MRANSIHILFISSGNVEREASRGFLRTSFESKKIACHARSLLEFDGPPLFYFFFFFHSFVDVIRARTSFD